MPNEPDGRDAGQSPRPVTPGATLPGAAGRSIQGKPMNEQISPAVAHAAPPGAEPAATIFSEAIARASRRCAYDAEANRLFGELCRAVQPLGDLESAAHRDANAESFDDFARRLAARLAAAAQPFADPELSGILNDRQEGPSSRLARAALREALRGAEAAERALRLISQAGGEGAGVSAAWHDIAKELARKLQERDEARLRREYPDLAPPAEDTTPLPGAAPDAGKGSADDRERLVHALPPASTQEGEPQEQKPARRAGEFWENQAIGLLQKHAQQLKKLSDLYPHLVAQQYPFGIAAMYNMKRLRQAAAACGLFQDGKKKGRIRPGTKDKHGHIEAADDREQDAA